MEVITKDEVRLNRNDQARRIEGYRFKLWMMEWHYALSVTICYTPES